MERLCILVTAENLEAVKVKAYENVPEFDGRSLLNYPLSETGDAPATHWFCPTLGSPELYEKLLSLKDLSIMEMADPTDFLEKHNLLVLGRKKKEKK